ncbi:hypothetical protein QNN00_10445 [Bacillus velezensis]|nr:hypothetical protein [Bacillus velezensis]
MDINITEAEQQAITAIALNGIFIFLKPYVNPTEKLSKLTAKAKSKERNNLHIRFSFLLIGNCDICLLGESQYIYGERSSTVLEKVILSPPA